LLETTPISCISGMSSKFAGHQRIVCAGVVRSSRRVAGVCVQRSAISEGVSWAVADVALDRLDDQHAASAGADELGVKEAAFRVA